MHTCYNWWEKWVRHCGWQCVEGVAVKCSRSAIKAFRALRGPFPAQPQPGTLYHGGSEKTNRGDTFLSATSMLRFFTTVVAAAAIFSSQVSAQVVRFLFSFFSLLWL